nr:hypothetical protein CFP56_18977 [Quercus suber]
MSIAKLPNPSFGTRKVSSIIPLGRTRNVSASTKEKEEVEQGDQSDELEGRDEAPNNVVHDVPRQQVSDANAATWGSPSQSEVQEEQARPPQVRRVAEGQPLISSKQKQKQRLRGNTHQMKSYISVNDSKE